MNAIETHDPAPTAQMRSPEAEWRRLILEGEQHMLNGDYQNARFAYLAALSFAKAYPPAYPYWNKTLANLRYLYVNYICSRSATVEERYAATVPEWEAALGENHFFIALWLELCVKAAENAEQYTLAERMWRKMLACWDDAPDLKIRARQMRQMDCLHGIARARFAQGNFSSASAYCAAALKTAERALGPDHSRLVVYLETAAEAARQQGDSKREARYTKRALQIRHFQPWAFAKADGANDDARTLPRDR